MKKQLISYELAVLAKQKGFNIKCKEYFQGFNQENSFIRFDEDEILAPNCFERPTREELKMWLIQNNLYVNMIMDFAYSLTSFKDGKIEMISSVHGDRDYIINFEKGLEEALNQLPDAI